MPGRRLTTKEKNYVRGWLKNHGHRPDKVNPLKLDSDDDLLTVLCEAHGLNVDDFKRITGRKDR